MFFLTFLNTIIDKSFLNSNTTKATLSYELTNSSLFFCLAFFFSFLIFILFFNLYFDKFTIFKKYKIQKITFIIGLLLLNSLILLIKLLPFLKEDNYFITQIWGADNLYFTTNKFLITSYVFIIIFFILLLLFSHNQWINDTKITSELPILLGFSVIGLLLFLASNHFIIFATLFIYLSLITSTLINGSNYTQYSAEGSIKNYIISGLASVFMILSLFLIHMATQAESFTDLGAILSSINKNEPNNLSFTLIIGITLLIIVFLIKLGAAPFHQNLIDAYEVAPLAVGSYLLGILKFGFFIFLIRFLLILDDQIILFISSINIINFLGFASLIFGIFSAFTQTRVRRLLNYSTVANLGFVLIVFNYTYLLASCYISVIYMTVYSLTIISLFGILALVEFNIPKREIIDLSDLSYLGKYEPFLGVLFCGLIFSLAGIPPFIGFYTKFFILYQYVSVVHKHDSILLLLLLSILPIFYYLRLIKIIFLDDLITLSKKKLIHLDNPLYYFNIILLVIILLIAVFGYKSVWLVGRIWIYPILDDVCYNPTTSIWYWGVPPFSFDRMVALNYYYSIHKLVPHEDFYLSEFVWANRPDK